jgi:hypothetical protein
MDKMLSPAHISNVLAVIFYPRQTGTFTSGKHYRRQLVASEQKYARDKQF